MSEHGDQGQKRSLPPVLKALRPNKAGSARKGPVQEPPVTRPKAKPSAPPAPAATRGPVTKKPSGATPVRVVNHVPTYVEGARRSSMMTFDAGRPFWQQMPAVALVFLKVGIAPLILLKQALDIALAAVLLATLLPLLLWLTGFIPNSVAIPFLEAVGTRGLEALRTLGLPL